MKRLSQSKRLAVLLVASLALAACGGGSDDEASTDSSSSSASATSSASTTEEETATSTEPTDEADSASTTAASADTEPESTEAAADTAAPSGETVSIKVGATSPSFSYGVPLAMIANDIDAEFGLDIEYLPAGTSSTNVIAAILSGEYDIGFMASSTALDAINQGGELEMIAGGLSTASVLVLATGVAEEKGITDQSSFEEVIGSLKGLTIATTPDGSGNNSLLRRLITMGGLDPNTDVEVVGVTEASAIVAGIKAERFDGGFYGSGVLENNVVDGSGTLVLRSGDLDMFEDYVGLAALTTDKFVEENPEVVSQFYDALAETESRIQADPDAMGAAISTEFFPDLDAEVFDVSWTNALPSYPSTPTISVAAWDTLVSVQTAGTGNDYSSLVYADEVYDRAQG